MNIQWNKVTWYSRLGAAVLFIIVVPVLAFVIGKEYQEVKDIQQYQIEQLSSPDPLVRNEISVSYSTSTVSISTLEFKTSVPVVTSSNKAVERKIDRSIKSRVDAIVKKYQNDLSGAPCKDRLGQSCKTSVDVTSTTTESSKFNSLSVEIDSFSTSEQMAHPDFEREATITFDLGTGEEKNFWEILNIDEVTFLGLDKISKISREKLKEMFGASLDQNDGTFLKGTDNRPENYQHILFGEDGLSILYSYYQIGPRPFGAPEVFITYKELGV